MTETYLYIAVMALTTYAVPESLTATDTTSSATLKEEK